MNRVKDGTQNGGKDGELSPGSGLKWNCPAYRSILLLESIESAQFESSGGLFRLAYFEFPVELQHLKYLTDIRRRKNSQ